MKIHRFILEVLIKYYPELFYRYYIDYRDTYKNHVWKVKV